MKRCKNITGWTDYPFTALGDASGKLAPIRRIKLLSYDGDKYCKILLVAENVEAEIKAGYIYNKPLHYKARAFMNHRKIQRMINCKLKDDE